MTPISGCCARHFLFLLAFFNFSFVESALPVFNTAATVGTTGSKTQQKMNGGSRPNMEPAVQRFMDFLSIKSISGEGPASGTYEESVQFLRRIADDVGLPHYTVTIVENKPILIMKWEGQKTSLPAIILNSHYDVVPVVQQEWKTDPFKAVCDDEGRIFARGTQDMKCVCMQYLEAVRKLKEEGYAPTRTLYLTFVPDEEIGGLDGMAKFLESPSWEEMQPVALALDEGLANPGPAYTVFYGERLPWWLLVKATGNTGHGSRFIPDTALEKLVGVCSKALAFRREQEARLGHSGGCAHAQAKKLGDVTTINLTMLKSGVTTDGGKTWALNVIPTEAEAGFDLRISPDMSPEEMRATLDEWCAAEGLEWRFAEWTSPLHDHYLTSLDREKNPWWGLFLDACRARGTDLEPEVFPAGTDSRFLRRIGVPAIGFSPIKNTPILLHDHNEFLHKDVFLEGIDVYEDLIRALASAEAFPGELDAAARSEGRKRKVGSADGKYEAVEVKSSAKKEKAGGEGGLDATTKGEEA